MGKPFLFNRIATVYGLFFNRQVRAYRHTLNCAADELNLSSYRSVIDIGCGTGALCKVLQEHGLKVIGIDPAESMLANAKKKLMDSDSDKQGIQLIHGDILNDIPLSDKSVDFAISSYVAHGLKPRERKILYKEMKRVAKYNAVLLDYNKNRSLITSTIEWLEGGNYFGFLESVEDELVSQFGNVKIIDTGKYSAMYICRIK